MKVEINPKIKDFAEQFGIEFRVGKTPKDVDIIADIPDEIKACYFGEGVIFVRDEIIDDRITCKEDFDFILCHEISHAILEFFPLEVSDKDGENFANAGALILMALLQIPTSTAMIDEVNEYTKQDKVHIWETVA